MLNDDLIDVLGVELVDVYQRLEDTVIRDIARRLMKSDRWTETAELQASFMRELGWSPARIRAEVIRRIHADPEYIAFVDQNTIEAKAVQQEAINEAKKELRAMAPEIYETVGNMSWNNDLSVWEKAGKKLNRTSAINQIIENYRKDGVDGILNLTGSMGFSYPTGTVSVRRAYTKALDDALVKTVSGSFSYTTALEDSVRELARSGLRHIDFANKVSRGIDTAVRNALLTSFAQLSGAIMQENIESSGVGYVQVSAHWGARPSHALWQGKVYTLQQFRDVCGYGEPGNSAHIYSYNCRHQHYPFWPGISEKEEFEPEPGPFTVGGKTYTYYQATQKQRAMERRIRELKREVNAGGDKARLGSLIRQKTQEYNSFSKAVNIRPKLERLRVASYDTVRGIKSPNWRSFASGLRKQANSLTEAEINALKIDIESIGADLSAFSFNTGTRTGLDDESMIIHVLGDVMPDENGTSARDAMSTRAVLAHEYYGHYKFAPSSFPIGDWRDEMRASYMAARNSPGLSRDERRDLIVDAYDRAREAGYNYEYSKWAKEIVYGY